MRPPDAAAGRAVAANEELVRLLVDSTTDTAVVTTDVDGVIGSWNPGAVRIFGYDADEILGHSVARLFVPEDAEAGVPDQQLATAMADGDVEDEGWRLRKDGSRFWANTVVTALRGEGGRLLGFGGVARDLTDRRRHEEALRESEERFRILVDSISDYAIFRLTPEGDVASWNRGAERLKGYRADEIVGRNFELFYGDEDRRAGVHLRGLKRALADGRYETEGWRVTKDGRRFWANVVITALYDRDGRHDGFAKVTRDLTVRKRTEDALRGVLERERDAAARLREVDEFRNELVAIVAHDVRGPLAVVRGFGELLLADWDRLGDDERRDLIHRMAERASALSDFVNDVFDTARLEAGQILIEATDLDLPAVVERVVTDTLAASGRRVDVRLPEGLPPAWGDAQRTWQILNNLVGNAVKFSPDPSPVVIEATVSSDEIVLTVQDRGPGIPADQQSLLFQRFTRLPQSSGTAGSGMGLFIARSLTEAQGGRIWVESSPGGGSRFRFTVPLRP